jgi:2-polyprenyl-3-methyl-5-hydroxy-6-metoxy-1,4-benzoquinol methylase
MTTTLSNTCPVCFSFNQYEFTVIETVENVQRVKCNRCNTIFFLTDPPAQTVYDANYISRFFKSDYLKKAAFSAAYLSDFARVYFKDPSILEVGLGNGVTTALLRHFGYNVWGNDVDTDLLYFIKRKFDIPLLPGDFTALKTDLRFDIIYSAQTLEHCNNPRAFFNKAFELLNPHGLLIIETPDIKYCNQNMKRWHHFETRGPFEHLVMFSEQSLGYLADFTGLDPLFFHSDQVFQSLMGVFARKGINPPNLGNLTPQDRFGRALQPVFFGEK